MSNLAQIPPAARRRMAWLVLPPACVLAIAGLIPLVTGAGPVWSLVGGLVVLVSITLALVAVGLRRSADQDESHAAETRLDADLIAAAPCGGACGDACADDACAVKSLPRL